MGRFPYSSYKKPVFRSRGAPDKVLLLAPPFTFPGVTARVFPLRANMNILRAFCRSYLNVAPEVCEFHPYLPCVLLVVLDYGRMAAEEVNLGWVSQREIYFSVPLGKWTRAGRTGPRTFRGWVVNTPFIFVDQPSSLSVGREVIGWPKILVELSPDLDEWLEDPRRPTRLLTLDVKGIGSHEDEGERLLEINQQLSQNHSLVPPDFELEMIDPFQRLSRLVRTSWSIGWDLAKLSLRAPLAGFGPRDPGGHGMALLDSLLQLFNFYNDPRLEALTLKQFPDAENPGQICYQALVQSPLSIARFNSGGFLGRDKIFQGDITGGFRIRIREHPSLPVVESLGLEVVRERTVGGRAVSTLEPFFPFWVSVDLRCGQGKTLCWRLRGKPWHEGSVMVGGTSWKRKTYNTFGGSAQQVWSGPFFIPGAECDVLPLRTHRAQLCRFIKKYLNIDDRFCFEPWGEHVYMVASSGRMFSKVRSADWIESCLISFYVPLTWCKRDSSGKRVRYYPLIIRPFVFVDNPTLAMTMREVQGVPAMDATIGTPSHSWLTRGPVLQMKADVFSALDIGLQCERQTLLEVMAPSPGAAATSEPPQPRTPPSAPPYPEFLCGKTPLPILVLKQFRDTERPGLACYQALLLERWTLSNPEKITPLPPQEIRIYRYPSLPLVDCLGLKGRSTLPPQGSGGALADVLRPEEPFRIRMDIEIGCAKGLAHTAESLSWLPYHSEDVMDLQSLFQTAGLLATGSEETGASPKIVPQNGIKKLVEWASKNQGKKIRCEKVKASPPKKKLRPHS